MSWSQSYIRHNINRPNSNSGSTNILCKVWKSIDLRRWIRPSLLHIMAWRLIGVNRIPGNTFQWNMNQDTTIFIQAIASENFVAVIPPRPHCVNNPGKWHITLSENANLANDIFKYIFLNECNHCGLHNSTTHSKDLNWVIALRLDDNTLHEPYIHHLAPSQYKNRLSHV